MPCACLLLGFLTWQSLWPVTDGRTDSCRPLAAPLVLLQAGQGIVQRAKEAVTSTAAAATEKASGVLHVSVQVGGCRAKAARRPPPPQQGRGWMQ